MARMARVVIPQYPHHVTQRGNRRQRTFFSDSDFRAYIKLLANARDSAEVTVWAYCLMPNHVHLVVVPNRDDSLACMFRDAHRQYTRHVNSREGWRGHLWQERFHSVVMDELHTLAAVRYVELNPVRAGLCGKPEQWPWSSARAHLRGWDDNLTAVAPMLDRISDWRAYLEAGEPETSCQRLRIHTRTGRPMGCDQFVEQLEGLTGRRLRTHKPGPKATASQCNSAAGDK